MTMDVVFYNRFCLLVNSKNTITPPYNLLVLNNLQDF